MTKEARRMGTVSRPVHNIYRYMFVNLTFFYLGNLVDWWEPATKENYLKKTQCVIDQYGNYTVEVDGETLNLNGINTQGENIADIGGIKETYR